MTEETTEIIETAPPPLTMPAVDPILMPLMLPFMLIQQISLVLMQMSMPQMSMPQMSMPQMSMPQMMQASSSAQQTIVKLGYDKDGNITSVYERRW